MNPYIYKKLEKGNYVPSNADVNALKSNLLIDSIPAKSLVVPAKY